MFKTLKDWLRFDEYESAKSEAQSYCLSPSIAQKFNIENFNSETGCFEFNNGRSVAMMYELFPISTEGQPQEYLKELRQGIERIFRDVFEQYYDQESPWVIQTYLEDDYRLDQFYDDMEAYIAPDIRETAYSQVYLGFMKRHYRYVSKKGGLFIDPLSNNQFQGRLRRLRMVIYRNLTSKSAMSRRATPESDLLGACASLENTLEEAHVVFKRYTDADFYQWFKPKFSPKPKGFDTIHDYMEQVPYPTDAKKPAGFDLVQTLFDSSPTSDNQEGVWYFDGLPHKFIPILGFTRLPEDGHLSAERKMTKSDDPSAIKYYAPFDRFPEGSMFMMTIVIQSQEYRAKELDSIERKAKKTLDTDAQLAREEAEVAKLMIADKNFLFPVTMGVYIKGDDIEDLHNKEEKSLAILKTQGFQPLTTDKDLVKLDTYIRFLPMNYSYRYDQKYLFRSRLCTTRQIAAVMPVYGRARGTGHPGFSGFNRLVEPFNVDPFKDYQNNAHGLILGTTGSGKSNQSAGFLMQTMAVHRPRMVIIDAGASFRNVIDLWERTGISVNKIEIKMEKPAYTLNPFGQTKKMLWQVEQIEELNRSLADYDELLEKRVEDLSTDATDNEKKGEVLENRDYLMEFVTAAIIMITGGEQKEIDALNRQDRYLVLEAIKQAGRNAIAKGFDEMIPEDLANTFDAMATELATNNTEADKAKSRRFSNMADGLKAFINMPLNAMYFNKRGKPLPEVDVTWFEMGLFKDDREENEAPRALAFITMMNNTMTMAEKNKASGRFTLFFGDEVHIVTNKPITAASFVQCTKMSRKVGLWIWSATQNVADFPDHAKKAVSMMEYVICLWSKRQERKKIAEFIELTPEQSNMIHSLRKEKRKYVEGLFLSNSGAYLYRNVPPRESLALAMTDPDENAERERLVRKYQCDGVEASLLMAQQLRGEDYDLAAIRELWHA
tara:strand:- start:54026 stop:56866 length:2841 start_codon:yes stop_codon:yes gene_type:complete